MEDRDAQAAAVLAALKPAPPEAQRVLLGLLRQPATPEALATVTAALQSEDKALSDVAIRTLGGWPNPAPAEVLYDVAVRSDNPTHRVLALRSYVQMAKISENPTAMYIQAMGLAKRPDDIRQVLSGLGHANTLVALEMAETFMAQDEFKAEATLAAIQVAEQYGWQDAARAQATLDRIVAESDNAGFRDQAKRSIEQKRKFTGHLFVWKGAGPYRIAGVQDGPRVFAKVFPPEQDPSDPAIRWVPIVPRLSGDRLNLEETFGPVDYCCAYLRTRIISPKDQQIRLEWGADDYITGWINGEPIRPDAVPLREGANDFMLKVGDHGGGWNLTCRLLNADGSPVDNVKLEVD